MNITIVIPIYNVEPYILECLESVSNQTLTEGVECILVDDCGTDNSVRIVDEFISNYTGGIQFSLIHHPQNGGLSAARNTAMMATKGRYVYFLDSDDSIAPDCIEEMTRLINKYPDVDMVIGNNDINDIIGFPFGEYTEDPVTIIRNLLHFNGRAVAAQRHMVRLEVIKENNLSFLPGIIHEDNLWTFLLSKHIHSIAFCPKDQYNYRKDNPNSIMRSKKIDKEIRAYRTIIEKCSANIDFFLKGTQRRYIYMNLQVALNAGYYENEAGRQHLIATFGNACSLAERLALNIYFSSMNGFVKRIANAVLMRLFSLDDRLRK